jgi:hypothetical protein
MSFTVEAPQPRDGGPFYPAVGHQIALIERELLNLAAA